MRVRGLRGVVIRCPDDGCECPQPSIGDHLLMAAAGAVVSALAPRLVEAIWPSKPPEDDGEGMTLDELADQVAGMVMERLDDEEKPRGKRRSR